MKISDLREEVNGNCRGIYATVSWEDSNRPSSIIYFETPKSFGAHLIAAPEPFLVGALLPALYAGERRISIDGDVCPQLLQGLKSNLGWFRYWHGRTICVEARPSPSWRNGDGRSRAAGLFLSGGVDSLYSLRANRLSIPATHPMSIRHCLLVDGFDMSWEASKPPQDQIFTRALASLQPLAAAADVQLIPVRTNLRHLNDHVEFWMQWFYGAALAAVAHACSGQTRAMTIASASDQAARTGPWGSTETTDVNYSSSTVRIIHDGLWVSRLEKLRVIAEWPAAQESLRVCTANHPSRLNCGQCEKCIRTMTALIALGKLGDTSAFAATNVTEEALRRMWFRNGFPIEFYTELVGPLEECGRGDLARGIRVLAARYRKYLAKVEGHDWRGRLKQLDRSYFGGRLLAAKRMMMPRATV